MKIISVDNYNRESVADILIQEGVDARAAKDLVDEYNDIAGQHSSRWYKAVADDYRLSRGMEDLV